MLHTLEQLLPAISLGGIYASLALALVMIYKSTGHVNLAQGEMATISTFVAWSLLQAGVPIWPAFGLTLVIAAVFGAGLERLVVRPFKAQPEAIVVTVFVGLFVLLNSVSGGVWGYTARPFPSAFPDGAVELAGGLRVKWHLLGSMLVSAGVLSAMFLFFRFTATGLSMRGAADNPASSRLLGIRTDRMLGLGWAISGVVGAVAGIMMAPITFLDPHMMTGPLVFFFAAALLGGMTSPLGAVIGGYVIGFIEVLIANFVPHGNELRMASALSIIVAVLLLRPQGLLGTRIVRRV
ncbi:branched-chain amino acid ABC transporter permease [Variovorax sp. WS11]|uniref:branched-chain amino acid ABC transporter permease n=1 Tax=Variovorax sp. WS11 TaxID=1105204 RepID=UPI000D0D3311|nr:branched-chain amino acid ABC transporter permease [Variovorax sp. WS11]NDZ17584.1 branched-chain amino acid ABC transporter permease [Variovorax sp. WS11]PSL82211.1 branched-chain amino acid ABC transporter permease [Variovorax sp. WS11]